MSTFFLGDNFDVFIKILFLIISLYAGSLGVGFMMAYGIAGKAYNMTTGHLYSHNNGTCNIHICTLCFNDQALAFYGGCFIVGLICNVIIILFVIFVKNSVFKLLEYLELCDYDQDYKQDIVHASEQNESLITTSDYEAGDFNPNITMCEYDSDCDW